MMTGDSLEGPSAGAGDVAAKSATAKSEAGTLRNGDLEMEIRDGKKYTKALKTFLPYRTESVKRSGILPSSHAGLFSFLTMSWMTPLMWKAFRQGLVVSDLWELDDADKAEKNAKRLKRIWEDEKVLLGSDNASFAKVIWKFGKTRFYLCVVLMILSVILQFLGPAWILKMVLNYQEDLTQPLEFGLSLAVVAFLAQLLRNLTYSGIWAVGIHTGLRIEGALQYMAYEKMLKLRNGGEAVLSQCITFCTNEQERIFECVFSGVLAIAAPVMFIMCLIYTTVVIGWWALLGNAVIFFFYPLMGIIAKFIGDFRRKAVKHTQKRVGLMNEILNSIRLIKMYGWEDSFSEKIKGIRTGEEKQQQKAAFFQSLTSTITPMVNTVASIAVFLGFTLAGNNLTSSDAFTIFSVFAAMQFTVGTLPFAMRAIAEAVNCLSRFKTFLELPEFELETEDDLDCDHDAVVVIQKGCFAWEVETQEGPSEKTMQPQIANGPSKNSKKKTPKQKVEENGKSKSPTPETEVLTSEKKKGEFVKLEDCLRGIDLEIKRGSLTGICGLVGSGKSSLLSAILGDMVKSSGKILIRGSLAIVSQQAWIYSDSFQENILFGSPMNKEKYEKVLDICCLRPDLQTLPHGDMTLIGERGVNLSGGQKQRVNLARAIYADKSIYLLDDPLAAVDSIIARSIFEKCIKEHLKDKTVILVTNAVQLLQDCESIMFIKDGEIAEHGRHSNLLEKKGHYYSLLQYHNQNEAGEIDRDTSITEVEIRPRASSSPKKRTSKSPEVETVGKKLTEDDSGYNFAGFKSYVLYLKACGGFCFSFTAFMLLLSFSLTRIFAMVWIQRWIDAGDGKMDDRLENIKNFTEYPEQKLTYENLGFYDNRFRNISNYAEQNLTYADQELKGYITENDDLGFYQLVLAISVLVILVVGLLKGLVTTRLVLFGASRLHERMFLKIIRSPMKFFDVTPSGKITNRFSKDMDELDARLPFFIEFVCQAVIFILSCLIVVCVVFPTFTVALVLILGIMIFMDIWLNFCVRETRKLENVLKSPVIHHLQSSLGGLSIIRTFRREDAFKIRFAKYVNDHLIAATVYRAANRWFTFRLDTVSLATIFVSMLMAVLLRGSVSPALIGLALSNIYMVCSFLPFVMRMKSELQSRFISVERILEYAEELKCEEPASQSCIQPEDGWPKTGGIKFDSVCMKYRDELDYVINEISFEVQPSEKIGVVGRTGAGKTSIIAALLRLYPIEKGTVTIDGLNTNEISLKNLRRSIAVIPQDPVLFQGTLRYNLDPFDDYSDEDIWSALEKSHIKSKIEKEEKKLKTPVSTDGENFSVGEKQLICLARALLRKNKILLLDEATANLDIETDFLIQNTIQEAFQHCTVITVAHRLNTIANYDRIIVMQKGHILEIDTPKNLMETEGSVFHKMMLAAGISSLDQLKRKQESTNDTDD